MSRVCNICRRLDRHEIDDLLACGMVSDHEVARRYKIERSSITRHRQRHLLKPLADRVALLARDAAEKQQRKELAQAVEEEKEPSTEELVAAHLGTRAMTKKFASMDDTLVRETEHAVSIHHSVAVATLTGTRVRVAEAGMRMVGTGGYRTPAVAAGGAGELDPKWQINMIFPNAGRVETITVVAPVAGGGDGEVGDVIEETVEE
jgi:hypothetical protein